MNLRKAFENVKKTASDASKAQADFRDALSDSKYSILDDLPDSIVDSTDYGTADMTYEEFIKEMNEALADYKESLKN